MNADLVNRYQRLKDEIDLANREKAQAEGRLAQCLAEMEKEFDCKTLAEAKKLLARLQCEADRLEEQFQQRMDEFEKKWDSRRRER